MPTLSSDEPTLKEAALAQARQALRLVEATLPHLSGLVRQVRLVATERAPVAAVSASGLTLLNPNVFRSLPIPDATYILAHELMHLALDTHGRAGCADRLTVNIAHDYIINDMLSEELGCAPPLGGLCRPGASERSLEEWIVELHRSGTDQMRCWVTSDENEAVASSPSPMSRALEDAGLAPPETKSDRPKPIASLEQGDLLLSEEEHEFEPEITTRQRQELAVQTRRAAVQVASLTELKHRIGRAANRVDASPASSSSQTVEAVRSAYRTPWERVLQRWVDSVAPCQRDYSRASRRAGNRTDCVLPGRSRHGWTMHIVLDTSGSMVDDLPHALGAIGYFCQSSGVTDVHILQCDSSVTSNRWIDISELARFEITGYGGSNMSAAMNELSEDPEVTAALVLTDGSIQYPKAAPPYDVLWALIGGYTDSFDAPYGSVVRISTATLCSPTSH